MRFVDEGTEVGDLAVGGMYVVVVGDVVAVVAHRRRVERQQPQRVHAEFLQVVEPRDQPGKVAHAVAVAVAECLDVQLVDDGVLVPEWIVLTHGIRSLAEAPCRLARFRRALPIRIDATAGRGGRIGWWERGYRHGRQDGGKKKSAPEGACLLGDWRVGFDTI